MMKQVTIDQILLDIMKKTEKKKHLYMDSVARRITSDIRWKNRNRQAWSVLS